MAALSRKLLNCVILNPTYIGLMKIQIAFLKFNKAQNKFSKFIKDVFFQMSHFI